MLNIKKFSELVNDEKHSSSELTSVSLNGITLQVKNSKLYVNGSEVTEEDLDNLANILSKVVVYEGIDKVIEILQGRIDDLYNSNIDEDDRVIPLHDIDTMLYYVSSMNESICPDPVNFTRDQLDQLKDYIVSRLDPHGIRVIDEHPARFEGSMDIKDYLSLPEVFWYIPWCMHGSLENANEYLTKVQYSILKYYDPSRTINEYTPIIVTMDGFKVTGDPIKSAYPPEMCLIWKSESDVRSYQNEVMRSKDLVNDLMNKYEMQTMTDVISNLNQLVNLIENDASILTFNGNPIGVNTAFKLIEIYRSLHPNFTKLIEGKLTGYILSIEGPANPVIDKYYREPNWGSSIASRLLNSLGKICYRWHNDGDDPNDFTSDPSFRFMIGVNNFMDRLSLKNNVLFNWGLLKVQSTLKSDSNLHYKGLNYPYCSKDESNEFIDFVEHLMDSESNGDNIDWLTEIEKFNKNHHSYSSYTCPILLDESPVETAYNLCGAMWEITKRYPNFLNDGSEDGNDINPNKF